MKAMAPRLFQKKNRPFLQKLHFVDIKISLVFLSHWMEQQFLQIGIVILFLAGINRTVLGVILIHCAQQVDLTYL